MVLFTMGRSKCIRANDDDFSLWNENFSMNFYVLFQFRKSCVNMNCRLLRRYVDLATGSLDLRDAP